MENSVVFNLVGVVAGGVITWFVARYYFIRASRELKEEATKLRRLNKLVLRGLENAGLVKCKRDEEGNVTEFIIQFSSSAKVSTKTSNIELDIDNIGD